MNLSDSGDPLTSHLVPPASFHLSCEISQHLLDGLVQNCPKGGVLKTYGGPKWKKSEDHQRLTFVVLSEISQQLLDGCP